MVEYAVLLLIASCVAVGVVSAVVTTWSLKARLYSLEERLELVEGGLIRETKARAGAERWKKPDKDLELVKSLQAAPTVKRNWWELNLPRQAP